MARQSWVQDRHTGKLIPKDEYYASRPASGTAVLGDMQAFVSPIDGKVVEGRVAFREHCLKHNVVPTADLAGLPPKPMNQEYKPDRAAIREELARKLYR